MSKDKQHSAEQTASAIVLGPGSRLRMAREELGLSQLDIAHRMHLRKQIIADIEDDNYSGMPKLVFVRGYLRAYANLVDVAGNEIIDSFNQIGLRETPTDRPTRTLNRSMPLKHDSPVRWLSYLIVIGFIGLGGVWWYSHSQSSEVMQSNVFTQPNVEMAPIAQPAIKALQQTVVPITEPQQQPLVATPAPPVTQTTTQTPGQSLPLNQSLPATSQTVDTSSDDMPSSGDSDVDSVVSSGGVAAAAVAGAAVVKKKPKRRVRRRSRRRRRTTAAQRRRRNRNNYRRY